MSASRDELMRQMMRGQHPLKEKNLTESELSFIEKIKTELAQASKEKFIFLLVGRSGVGKSSTINTLIGQKVAGVSNFTIGTKAAQKYEAKVSGIDYVVVDTPGLADSSGNEQQYIDSIKSEVSEFHCMLFVTILDESRLRDDEAKTIKSLSSAFGLAAWERAVIIFTHADRVSRANYSEFVSVRTGLIRQEIAKHIPSTVANQIPAVAVANNPKTSKPELTPDGEPWLGKLYTAVFQKISAEGKFPFFLATANRFNQLEGKHSEPIPITPAQKREVTQQIMRVFDFSDVVSLTALGASIGALAGPVGAAFGGVVGVGMATLAWFFKG